MKKLSSWYAFMRFQESRHRILGMQIWIFVKNPVFKYEKIELLVCIYEISRELVCKYGIYACSRCLTPATIVNPIPSQVHMRQLVLSQPNHEIMTFTTMLLSKKSNYA